MNNLDKEAWLRKHGWLVNFHRATNGKCSVMWMPRNNMELSFKGNGSSSVSVIDDVFDKVVELLYVECRSHG